MARVWALWVGACGAGLLCFTDCASPTALAVSVYTDIPCSSNPQAAIVGGSTIAELSTKVPSSTSTRCTPTGDGSYALGEVYVTPSGSKSAEVAFEVMIRPDGESASSCTDPANAAGCIVARRQLRFIRHQDPSMRVDLRTTCLGVTCKDDQTCVQGQCVSAQTSCAGGSCDEATLLPSTGGVSPLHRIAGGASHTCAITSTGGVKCWGSNLRGELGNGNLNDTHAPVDVTGLTGVISLAAGLHSTCALMSNRTVKCWGKGDAGGLGNGTSNSSSVPVDVQKLANVLTLGAGCKNACAQQEDGVVKCWGLNDHGQNGDGTTNGALVPTAVVGLSNATSVAVGFHSTCATANGGALCWGDDASGQLGDGKQAEVHVPVQATQLPFTPLLLTSGAFHVFAYGLDPTNNAPITAQWGVDPSLGGVPGLASVPITSAGAGDGFTCLVQKGGVMCWGSNNANGQLGNGTTKANLTAAPVTGLESGVLEVAGGFGHACAILVDGRIECWGGNGNGQLGDGTTTNRSVPVPVTPWP